MSDRRRVKAFAIGGMLMIAAWIAIRYQLPSETVYDGQPLEFWLRAVQNDEEPRDQAIVALEHAMQEESSKANKIISAQAILRARPTHSKAKRIVLDGIDDEDRALRGMALRYLPILAHPSGSTIERVSSLMLDSDREVALEAEQFLMFLDPRECDVISPMQRIEKTAPIPKQQRIRLLLEQIKERGKPERESPPT